MTAGFEKQLPAGMNISRPFRNIVTVCSGRTASLWFSKCVKGRFGTRLLSTYKDLTDALFYMPGVARHTLTSLWTPNSRYFEITEDGFVADDVIPVPSRLIILTANAYRG